MQYLRRLTLAIFGVLLLLQSVRAEIVSIVTWNLEWFPGGKPTSSEAERLVHMSAAKEALLDLRADILCFQEVRDWDSVAELVSILPNFQTLVVSRFREMGSSGPLSIQQTAIASNHLAEAAWSESFKPSPVTPPRGFSFAAIRHGKTLLLIYSVHFKSNRGDATSNIGKSEEAARQLLTHVAEMEKVYSQNAKIVTVIAGDFNTDPTDARFVSEETFALLKAKFGWSWEKVPLAARVTNPAKGRYPDACFDGFLVRGARNLSCKPIPIQGEVCVDPVCNQIAKSAIADSARKAFHATVGTRQQIEAPFPRCNSLAVARSAGTLFASAGRSIAKDALGRIHAGHSRPDSLAGLPLVWPSRSPTSTPPSGPRAMNCAGAWMPASTRTTSCSCCSSNTSPTNTATRRTSLLQSSFRRERASRTWSRSRATATSGTRSTPRSSSR